MPPTSAGNDCLALVSRGDIRGSSFEFLCRQDDFTYNGGALPVRHLVSVQVRSVSPVRNPAYLDSTVSLRSFTTQFDADPDDVIRDARAGELRRYFARTDVASLPEGLAVAQRSQPEPVLGMDLATRKAIFAHRAKDPTPGGMGVRKTVAQMIVELNRRKMEMDGGGPVFEERTLDLLPARRDRYGHALDWHPTHR